MQGGRDGGAFISPGRRCCVFYGKGPIKPGPHFLHRPASAARGKLYTSDTGAPATHLFCLGVYFQLPKNTVNRYELAGGTSPTHDQPISALEWSAARQNSFALRRNTATFEVGGPGGRYPRLFSPRWINIRSYRFRFFQQPSVPLAFPW